MQLPADVQRALIVAAVAPREVPADLIDRAARDGVTQSQLDRCTPGEVRMILTKDEPWWQLLCQGNPIMAESALREAGYPEAFAGAPGRIWLRRATADERAEYEAAA